MTVLFRRHSSLDSPIYARAFFFIIDPKMSTPACLAAGGNMIVALAALFMMEIVESWTELPL
jgi:hypothetical protein